MCVEKDHLWAHTTGENGFTGRKRITCHTKMCKNSFSSNRYILESSPLYTLNFLRCIKISKDRVYICCYVV